MSLIIPAFAFPSYTFQITLDSEIFRFTFDWNTSYEFWTLSIADFAGTILLAGMKVVINYPLIRRYGSAVLPKGEIVAVDTTGKLQRIGRDDLGVSVQLVYVPRDEYDAIV